MSPDCAASASPSRTLIGASIPCSLAIAAALIDRLLHHCHLGNIRGNSRRMREHTELYRALQPEIEPAASARRSRRSKAAGY